MPLTAEQFRMIRPLRTTVCVQINGASEQKVISLVSEEVRCALLSNGHIPCVPTVEMYEAGLDVRVCEVAILRKWVEAMPAAADWRDRDAATGDGGNQ